MKLRILLIVILTMCVPGALAVEITTVTLRSTVRLHTTDVLTLGQLAHIVGSQEPELSQIPISSIVTTGQWTRIGVQEIRELLKEMPRARVGSVVVSGPESFVTRRPDRTLASHTVKGTDPAPKVQVAQPTLHDSVKRWVARRFGVQPKSLRLDLRDSDREALARPLGGRLVEIRQIGNGSRLTLRLTVYQGERIERSFTISTKVQVQRTVMVLNENVTRGTMLVKSMYSLETQWFPASETPANPVAHAGQTTRSAMRIGTIVMSDDVESPIVIKRGDIVSARSIAGTVVVNLRARALSSVRDGELLELESLDRKSRFTARASGPGRAVIIKDTQAQVN
ncbi:MAG: flagellar basal body P-ring formation protein FlgA [Phycisphaerales bacterium]|nr:flagellar basal body P-ring formation protein FlgA [Phycisphaerales bacterium]